MQFIIKLNSDGLLDTTGLSTVQMSSMDSKINVYPNPVSDNLYITTDSPEDLQIRILDVSGALIESYKSSKGRHTRIFDFSNYPAGTYVLQSEDQDGKVLTKKILKL